MPNLGLLTFVWGFLTILLFEVSDRLCGGSEYSCGVSDRFQVWGLFQFVWGFDCYYVWGF